MGRADGRSRTTTAGEVDDADTPILHVDMDAFFASVELLARPELRGRPVIIGHPSRRSVVTSATYEARRFGVRAAMPMAAALRLCPSAIVLEPHYEDYVHQSRRVMELFRNITPLVEPVSIDEAFLDVAGARRLFGTPCEVGELLRRTVSEETGLTCSVGVAATKFVAKLASGRAKPDGLLVVPAAETLAFLHPLPIEALWGVGEATGHRLRRLGLTTVADLAATPVDVLVHAIGEAGGRRLYDLAWGRDSRRVAVASTEKSVGHEVTFEEDVRDDQALATELLRLADRVGARLRSGGLLARTVAIKVRYPDFTTVGRSRTLSEPTDVGRRIHDEALTLFESLDRRGRAVRLLGVRAEHLVTQDEAGGRALWDPDEEWSRAERAVDQASQRFGPGAVRPASLLRSGRDRPRPPVPE